MASALIPSGSPPASRRSIDPELCPQDRPVVSGIGVGQCYNPQQEGGTIDINSKLKEEKAKIAGRLNAVGAAIAALSGLDRRGATRGPHRKSASARAKISAAQKARWAKA